eukprot:CAMPEP_0170215814 /NCGR_PEP_ID=MMETSP0116_2-20130129/7546_1 /TAXON_ID=400756 /ORGANISM="Durinskia baltica, Strain CSIRO CS-38" /LENGTH=343 /DNA_ID=CAMNT_0010466395 /DNA_START=102 /DNA_END=1129 /DNA_ORIENTATION=+
MAEQPALHAVYDVEGGPAGRGGLLHVPTGMWPPGADELEDAMGIGGMHWLSHGAKYMQRTKVTEYLYFTKRSFRPLFVSFADGAGVGHRITVDASDVSLVVPLDSQKRFTHVVNQYKGVEISGDGSTTRILVDPRSTVLQLCFSYQPKAVVHSHGVRIDAVGYELEAAEPGRKTDFEELEDRYFRTLRARISTTHNPRGAVYKRHGTFDRDPSPERLDRRAEIGRLLFQRALTSGEDEHEESHHEQRDATRSTEAQAEFGRMLFQGVFANEMWDSPPYNQPRSPPRAGAAASGANPFGSSGRGQVGNGGTPFGGNSAGRFGDLPEWPAGDRAAQGGGYGSSRA